MLYFRFPFSDRIYTTDQRTTQDSVGFVSFDETKNIEFQGNVREVPMNQFLNSEIFTDALSSKFPEIKDENQQQYQHKLLDVIDFIKENNLSKLVISRRKLLEFNDSKINLSQTFLNLCSSYPNAFVYFFIRNEECWMGAFSELLGKFDKKTSEFETMSLAGTLPVNEVWTSKEIEEQKPVSDFIKNILKNFSQKVSQSETYDHISGNIKHLRNDFKAKIDRADLEKLMVELHPTPAVCGIPKEFCRSAISKFEEYPRNFYAGYIRVETEEAIQYFVNLRCAEFFRNNALLYVGGGITADSSPQKEWQETELKADAVLKNIAFS